MRLFLLVEGATFVVASLVHSGVLVEGFEHARARIAEAIIGALLLSALAAGYAKPAWTRGAAIAAQWFALLGTLVGIVTMIVGIGPRTLPDGLYHVAIVALLIWRLVVAHRSPEDAGPSPAPSHGHHASRRTS